MAETTILSSEDPYGNAPGPVKGELVATSYNIHSSVGIDGRYDPERIVKVLREIDAHIVGLQEVGLRSRRSRRRARNLPHDQFEYLSAATNMHAVAGPNIRQHRGHFGNALFSRLPIRDVRLLDLTIPPYEPRGAIDADVELGGGILRVIVTHLGLRRGERRQQLIRLDELIGRFPDSPLIVLGDFNIWGINNKQLMSLGAVGGRTFCPATFPARLPFLAFDRIWTRPRQMLRWVRPHTTPLSARASDHLPVTALIDLSQA